MGPKKFEKEFKKRMGSLWNETKIFFSTEDGQAKVSYIDGNELKSVIMYREEYALDQWENHFLDYLMTGKFDDQAYWRTYSGGVVGEPTNFVSPTEAIKMICKKKVWSEHSPELSTHMANVRSQPGMSGVGFKVQPKPKSM